MEEKKQEEEKNDKNRIVYKSNEHIYEFIELEALMGRAIYHEVLAKIEDKFDKMESAIKAIKGMPTKEYCELCAIFLQGARIDDEECDDLGTCSIFRRNPREELEALVFSIAANYPDSFPLLREGADTGEPLSQR